MARGFVRQRNGVWYAYWRTPDGKQKAKSCGTRKKDAEAFLDRIQSELRAGTYIEESDITFGAFADKWLKEYVGVYAKKSTQATYTSQVNRHIKPFFKDRKLRNITTKDVASFLSNMADAGLAKTSQRQYLVTLKGIFENACVLGYIRTNPAAPVKLPEKDSVEPRFLTKEEVKAFLAVLPDSVRLLFRTLVMTGMRLGEALALEWGDIDFAKGTIRVTKTDYRGTVQRPKTLKGVRTVGMSSSLSAALVAHRSHSESTDGRVFLLNGQPIRQHLLLPIKERAIKDAGLTRFRIHDLRHTYASLLINAGENLKYIQKQLGHASIEMTGNLYGHLYPDAHREAGMKLDAIFEPKDAAEDVV